jgi:hypothetical protein
MQRKATSIGVDLTIETKPGMGTTLCIKIRRWKQAGEKNRTTDHPVCRIRQRLTTDRMCLI